MSKAPRDGTRIIAMCDVQVYSGQFMGYVTHGHRIVEIWYREGRWAYWLGTPNACSTERPVPRCWWPRDTLDISRRIS